MAGLLPDFGDFSSVGTPRVAPPDGASADISQEQPSATIISINGDTITINDGASNGDFGSVAVRASRRFDENLAERLSDSDLGVLAQSLLEGIDNDIRARAEFNDNYRKGLDYLGLNLTKQATTRGKRTTAKVVHPALQWACTKFQSGVRAELLPASGPVKVWNSGEETPERDELAKDLEKDLNWYLTSAAPEYYPDTDRGFYYLGYGGTVYKKIYRCPIRQRPVSDTVYLTEVYVSPEAQSLQTALRITHDIGDMTEDDMIRYMSLGVYREIPLHQAVEDENILRKAEKEIAGVQPSMGRPEDVPYRIFECYCYLDLSRYGIIEPGQPKAVTRSNGETSRAPLPYRVTIERDTMTILEIRRNWSRSDRTFQRKRTFVEYGVVPGMGNQNYGYLHLIGNITQALTALLRLVIDAGMFSNFPGGVRLRGARADTNEINPAPGEWAALDTGGTDDIRKAIMAMPYKEPSQVLLALISQLEKQCQTLMGAVEMGVGEGKTHIPVGTMLAMIEQQTQTMAAVHKRLHQAQQQEFSALKEVFAENPQDLIRMGNISGRIWSPAMFVDLTLVPAADPNIPSQVHRLMQGMALFEIVKADPNGFNIPVVRKRLLKTIGIGQVDELLNPNQAPQPSPADQAKMAEIQQKNDSIKLQAQGQEQQLQKQALEGKIRMQELALEEANNQKDRESRERVAELKHATELLKIRANDQHHMGEGIQPRRFASGGIVSTGDDGDDFISSLHSGLANVRSTGMVDAAFALRQVEERSGDALAALAESGDKLRAALSKLRRPKRIVRDKSGRAESVMGADNDE